MTKSVITAPIGFEASAVNAGIKKKGLDLALIVSQAKASCAGVFTSNKFKAAPVLLSEKHLKALRHKAVIINSGNANCLTGKKGIADANSILSKLSLLINCAKHEVLVCSTGIIGKRLPIAKINKALPALVSGLSKTNAEKTASAIMTTDTFKKQVVRRFMIGEKTVTIAGIAKGAGMIAPNLATMICVITTDAKITKTLLKKSLREAVDNSFNCITVDGDMSTNDTVLIMANGLSGVNAGNSNRGYRKFSSALGKVCLELAKMIVMDAEGATKFIEVEVKNAKTKNKAKTIALAISNSSLFKTMCFGNDPNFGRIAAAVGAAGEDINISSVDIYINNKRLVKSGVAVNKTAPGNLLKKRCIKICVDLRSGNNSSRIFTSDLSVDYVRINAEYS